MDVKPWGGADYQKHWGFLNVEGRVVLDVGADYGSTAVYFLSKGADGVIAVEGCEGHYRRLEALAEKERRIVPAQMHVSCAEDWWIHLHAFEPDVLKVDCEGCEAYLLDVSDSSFASVVEMGLEVHDPRVADWHGNPHEFKTLSALKLALIEKFVALGFTCIFDAPHGEHRIVYLRREDGSGT